MILLPFFLKSLSELLVPKQIALLLELEKNLLKLVRRVLVLI